MAGELLKLFEEELDNPTRESLEKTGLTLASVLIAHYYIYFDADYIDVVLFYIANSLKQSDTKMMLLISNHLPSIHSVQQHLTAPMARKQTLILW